MTDGITVIPKSAPESVTQDFAKDEIHPIAGLLGLDTHKLSSVDSQNIKAIYDFVRGEEKEMTELELLHKVREIEQKLGLTSLGERRVDKVFRYVKLQNQIDNLTAVRNRELR